MEDGPHGTTSYANSFPSMIFEASRRHAVRPTHSTNNIDECKQKVSLSSSDSLCGSSSYYGECVEFSTSNSMATSPPFRSFSPDDISLVYNSEAILNPKSSLRAIRIPICATSNLNRDVIKSNAISTPSPVVHATDVKVDAMCTPKDVCCAFLSSSAFPKSEIAQDIINEIPNAMTPPKEYDCKPITPELIAPNFNNKHEIELQISCTADRDLPTKATASNEGRTKIITMDEKHNKERDNKRDINSTSAELASNYEQNGLTDEEQNRNVTDDYHPEVNTFESACSPRKMLAREIIKSHIAADCSEGNQGTTTHSELQCFSSNTNGENPISSIIKVRGTAGKSPDWFLVVSESQNKLPIEEYNKSPRKPTSHVSLIQCPMKIDGTEILNSSNITSAVKTDKCSRKEEGELESSKPSIKEFSEAKEVLIRETSAYRGMQLSTGVSEEPSEFSWRQNNEFTNQSMIKKFTQSQSMSSLIEVPCNLPIEEVVSPRKSSVNQNLLKCPCKFPFKERSKSLSRLQTATPNKPSNENLSENENMSVFKTFQVSEPRWDSSWSQNIASQLQLKSHHLLQRIHLNPQLKQG